MGLRVKICGITQPAQGIAIAHCGATALGFICAPSPRYVTPEQIAAVVSVLPIHPLTHAPISDRIGVFVNADLDTIVQTVAIGRLSGVQLHGQESPAFCDRLRQALPGIELIKALRVRTAEALLQAESYADWVDTILLDAYHPNMAGGTGTTLDWAMLRSFNPRCPWLLAGGLTPDNVLEALAQVTPHGIDLSSGVEHEPGNKDLAKVARLFEQLSDQSS